MITTCAAAASSTGYKGRKCTPPAGHRIVDCRLAKHGTPDLSRAAFRALRGAEVTFSERIDDLVANPAAGGAREWPLIDSLGQPVARLISGGERPFTVIGSNGESYRVTSVRVRGRGCAANTAQQARFTLVQVIAKAPSGGTQAFLDTRALNGASPSGRRALAAFQNQRGTGCGPSGPERGKLRPLANPRVGARAHADLLQRRRQRRHGIRRQARLRATSCTSTPTRRRCPSAGSRAAWSASARRSPRSTASRGATRRATAR